MTGKINEPRSSGRRLGVGIVGAGMVADTHVRALKDLGDLASITGVHSRDAAKLDAFCRPRGLKPFASLVQLIGDPGTDVLLVLTPPDARLDIVRACADVGKHVLLEKPIERTLDAAAEIVALAKTAGIKLGVIFQHRFRPASLALAEKLRSGALGSIASVQVSVPWWRPQSYYDTPGRGTYARDGGGVLITQAIHTLDLMLQFTGPARRVFAMSATTLHQMEAEDFVSAGLEFESGAVGSLLATTASFPGEAESIVLNCRNGSVKLAGGVATLSYLDGRSEVLGAASSSGGGADPMAFTHDWHAAAQRDFLQAVIADAEPSASGCSALGVHRLIDALMRSAAGNVPASTISSP